MTAIIFAVCLTLSGISGDCDKDFQKCRNHCGQTHNPNCLIECYQQFNECKRNSY